MKVAPRRLYGPTILAGLAAGGIGYFAAGRVWASATVEAAGLPPDTVTVTGKDALPVVSALALVIVAASIAVIASRSWFRRIVGVLMVIAGVAGAVSSFRYAGPAHQALGAAIKESPAYTGSNFPVVTAMSVWPLVAGCALVLAAILGAFVAWFATRWPTMGRKYDAPAARRDEEGRAAEPDLWKALDEGRDPTQ